MVGDKRHLLTLQTRTETLDALGEATPTYQDLAKVWGRLEAVSSKEQFESQQIRAEVSHRITIRYASAYAALKAEDRIVIGSRTFDIVTPIDKEGRRRELEITAMERL